RSTGPAPSFPAAQILQQAVQQHFDDDGIATHVPAGLQSDASMDTADRPTALVIVVVELAIGDGGPVVPLPLLRPDDLGWSPKLPSQFWFAFDHPVKSRQGAIDQLGHPVTDRAQARPLVAPKPDELQPGVQRSMVHV